MSNYELYHHGVLGMKWGVRKDRDKTGRSGKKNIDDGDIERTRRRGIFKRKSKPDKPKRTIKDLSDEELRARINRMELEKRYKDLAAAENPDRLARGKQVVANCLVKSGENLIPQVINHYGAKLGNKLIGETVEIKDETTGEIKEVIKEVMFANNKKK